MKFTKNTLRTVRPAHIAILATIIALSSLSMAAARKKYPMSSRDKWQQPDRVVGDLGLKEGSKVADVGCGSGYFTFRLSKIVGEKGKVFATEISEKGLKSIDTKAKKANITNIQTIKSDPKKTKLAPCSVDAAIIVNVLHHVKKDDRVELVKDIAAALKPGGSFFILDWRMKAGVKHDLNHRVPRKTLIEYAESAGLKLDAEFLYLENQVFLRFNKPVKK
ncbi:MAG: class I SAM-dependent methyltransferase [Phycisphaerales bacterium]|jgi:predicted methyltransferase|nr:class I SAM-dependent methyltransferase [Phycisphaerales bacterium]